MAWRPSVTGGVPMSAVRQRWQRAWRWVGGGSHVSYAMPGGEGALSRVPHDLTLRVRQRWQQHHCGGGQRDGEDLHLRLPCWSRSRLPPVLLPLLLLPLLLLNPALPHCPPALVRRRHVLPAGRAVKAAAGHVSRMLFRGVCYGDSHATHTPKRAPMAGYTGEPASSLQVIATHAP
jgi:hypothetical protein